MPRFFCPTHLHPGLELALPASAARHVQVLRLQPGDSITLFNHGPGWEPASGTRATIASGEYRATVTHMGRSEVQVRVQAHHAIEREAPRTVHLAVGMPANERMDWLVEKATELGVASIQPLMTERSVLRLSGERADKKVAHWQSVAVAACEQCGGNRVPTVHPVYTLAQWLSQLDKPSPSLSADVALSAQRVLLSLREEAVSLQEARARHCGDTLFLSGPEGGLSPAEEVAAMARGFKAVTLGPRVLRAETAALAALTRFAME